MHDIPAPIDAQFPRIRHEGLPPLRILPEHHLGTLCMERWIRESYAQRPLRILEAGCGNKWPLKLDIPFRLTAVDVDASALAIRKTKMRDVDEAIQGDLRDSRLVQGGSYDVVYNSFVLEHVQGAEQVLDNLFGWLAPNGLLILQVPDRDTAYGFLTRITPFWSHVMLKRYVYRMPNAGKPGFDPYPTFHEPVVSRRGIHEYCRRRGHVIRDEFGYGNYLPSSLPLRLIGTTVVHALALVSLGRLEWRYNNLALAIQNSPLPHPRSGPATEKQRTSIGGVA